MEAKQEPEISDKCSAAVEVLETTGLDTSKLDEILPRQFRHHIVSYEELGSSDHFKAEIRVNIFTKEEALEWVRDFEEITGTNFRTRKTFKENSNRLIYKKLYRCHKNTVAPKSKVVKRPNARNVGCSAMLCITVKNNKMKWSSDVLLQDFPCIIGLKHNHCHSLTTPDTLRYRRPLPELKEKFAALFAEKITPTTALKIHKLDLQRQYGDKYDQVVHDSAKCPHLHWVYKLYYTIYQRGVKEGKRKGPKRTSMVKKVKIKGISAPERNLVCPPAELYVSGGGVYGELISDVDISIISETKQLEVGSSDTNPSNFCQFENITSMPNEEVQRSIESLQQCDSDEFVLFENTDSSYDDSNQVDDGQVDDSQVEVEVNLDPTELHIEPSEVEMEQAGIQMEQPNVQMEQSDVQMEQSVVQVEESDVQVEESDETNFHSEQASEYHETVIPVEDTNEEVEQIGKEIGITIEDNCDRITKGSRFLNEATQECINNMESVFCDIKIKLANDPGFFTPPAQKFVSRYQQMAKAKDQDRLASALENFGLKPTVVSAIANFAKTLDTGEQTSPKPEASEEGVNANMNNVSPSLKKRKIIFVKLTQPPLKKIC